MATLVTTPTDRAVPRTGSSAGASAQPLTVLIADDHALVRDGIKMLVSSILGPVHFLEAGDGYSLSRVVHLHASIDLALVDLNMPGMDKGFRLIELTRERPALSVVVVSALTSPDVVRRTLDIPGVYAFVPKSATSDRMRAAIEAALQGTRLPYTPVMEPGAAPDVTLTPRLEEVRALLRQGLSNKLIASTLGISEGTVKNHMTEIFRALNVSNRTQAARHNSETL
jgi:DNA-binding NarL/FixJ family response regulator